jgi:hypothetical protein
VDRSSLPAPWDDPLVFRLIGAERTIDVEVQRSAAFEFTWAPEGSISFMHDRIDIFLLDLEEAVDRLYDEHSKERMILDWNDLYSDRS